MLKQFAESTAPKTKGLRTLYNLVRKLGPVRINTLTELTGYKHVTCTRLLDELVQEGLIYDSGIGASSGGRKPMMYVIKPDAFYLIGTEITSLYTTVLLLDLNLDIIASKKLKMAAHCTGEFTLNFVTQSVDELLASHNIQKDKLLGIGVGFIEPIDKERGVLLNPHLFPAGGWQDLNIIEYLQQKNTVSVFFDNGTNLAALAEYRKHYWKETDNLVFVSSDTEIRCGTISHGKLVNNNSGMDDAFGHTIIDMHGRRCLCGAYGCLQAYSSLPAIHDEVVRQIKRGRSSSISEIIKDAEEIDLHHVLSALEEKDPLCVEVTKDAAYYFGIGLSNLIYLLRPEIVICGGTLVPQSLFYEIAADTAQNRLKQFPNSHVQILKSTGAYNIVAQGAGCLVLDHFTEEK
ncbi:ROK family protein [Planococcus sp. N028]|uniref:ROK family protein n=1 Tax=Planococcus shixiaomingii TaxID=3058393 RepID=A0ABT8MZC8_9BACL|nr:MULTISPECIES: ROK family protein [unclassified Planococcus (in: firmicutes)]MDN7240695.1 ROK family protein [Planococcus sp. N028]WKA56600.1 ROK family protein [Planococcus sp. N022]